LFYGFSEIGIRIFYKRLRPKKKERDITEILITASFILAMYVSLFESLQRNHHWHQTISIFGTILLLLGTFIRLTGLIQIGKGFSTKVERTEGQSLITNGLYRFIRHPLYLATILQAVGSELMLCSFWAWIFIAIGIYAVLLRIRKEELFLCREFSAYREYMSKTRKLVPWIF
jgi:protein-S-isoprenylcysteine O-methyltransferase Ste14